MPNNPDNAPERALQETEELHQDDVKSSNDDLGSMKYPQNTKKEGTKTKEYNQFWQNVKNNDFS